MFKYLFKALLSDNTIIEQNQQDLSPISPGKNCFYDVIQAEKVGKLRAFAVYNQETGDEYLIDLQDCHFEVNQRPFFLHNDLVLSNIRLIWFIKREMVLDLVNTQIQQNLIKSYNFGFQGLTKDGENKQFILSLRSENK